MDRVISASQANQRFSKMLRDVQSGDSFVVVSRGRAVARVGPVTSPSSVQPVNALLRFLETLPGRSAGAWTRDDLYE